MQSIDDISGTPTALNTTTENDTKDNQNSRFQIELEFLLCLANPWYINFLAQQEYFSDPCFVNYLEYLKYWKSPEYVKFVHYPLSLYFLDLLQHPEFREAMKSQEATTFVHGKQFYHWLYARRPKVALEPLEENETPTETNNGESVAPEKMEP